MASAGVEKELECSICLTLYTDPVTLRCGHNFCRVCINQMLNMQEMFGVYSCPVCREEFHRRPTLKRNMTLCNVLEKFLSNHGDDASALCTGCVYSPVPPDKSCLHCEASLCDKRLKVHNKTPEHVLTDPSTSLESRKRSVHTRILEYYCSGDASCSCASCSLAGEHQQHKLETLDEVFRKKEILRHVLQKTVTQRQKTEEKVQSLEEHNRKIQEKASREAEGVTVMFIDIRKQVDDLEKRLLSEISWRKEQASLSLSEMIQKVEMKKDELSRKMRRIEELCNMTDPLTFLQEPDTGDLCDPQEDGGDGDTGGYDVGDRDAELISYISQTLSDMLRDINVTFYVQDPADILLDINTAGNHLHISDDLKTVTWAAITQNRPETSDRFRYYQVMSRRGFISGRHYWDVEISGSDLWMVGMCYPSIDRKGRKSFIGNNNKSWSLYKGLMYNNQFSVKYDNNEIQLPHQISSERVRICVNYEAGQLSFYELCDPIKHLHTFNAAFTEPLHAVLYVWNGYVNILRRTR